MTGTSATGLLVIHDLGSDGGGPWAHAFSSWGGAIVAPDLPGHGSAPPPVGGHHEAGDAVFALIDHLSPPPGTEPVVVGVGKNGLVARTLALGGRASALVLVDGLGGPWLDLADRNAAVRDARRAILTTPGALEIPAPGTPDARAQLTPTFGDRAHTVRMLAAVPVPTLVVETPSSVVDDADAVASVIEDHTIVRIDSDDPESVAAEVIEWWVTTRSTASPG